MMKKALFTLFSVLILTTEALPQELKSPDKYLGYELGTRFSRHHSVVDYFKYLAENSNKMELVQYGETYEHRPLYYSVISTEENLSNIDAIRENNLKRTGLLQGNAEADGKTIVWLSYNIHGNEASSTEAAMKTAYTILSGAWEGVENWLENTIVIIDPCINPDGRDRYANFYNQYGAKNYDPNGASMEHNEPWPGGRPNHYLFDLNRDWAWQTQQESMARSVVYHQWMPHIHVDFHEQGVNSPYYFAPAAEPFHEVITDWQRDFQTQIGLNHTKYFNKNNWLYFTRERFDLFYPSYGDTYPTYNGAIGMTYEQAGHGRGGLGVITEFGDTLTLKDRIAHHFTTGMSTIEIAAKNASKLGEEFKAYFDRNQNNPADRFKSYVIRVEEKKIDDIRALKAFLDKQQIEYQQIGQQRKLKGYDFFTQTEKEFTAKSEDLLISSYQPKSTLIQSLFDPKPAYSDSLTYDITAWALPYAYNVQAYGVSSKLSGKEIATGVMAYEAVSATYSWITPYRSFADAQFLASLLKAGINVRVADKPIQYNNQQFGRGALIITNRNNEHVDNLETLINDLAKRHGQKLYASSTGYAQSGPDMGSADIAYRSAPNVALVGGNSISSLAFGEVWHYFERQLDYPVTTLWENDLSWTDLSAFDVLIMPSGRYNDLSDSFENKLRSWVSQGGKLIMMGSANNYLKGKDGFALIDYTEEEKKNKKDDKEVLKVYSERERKNLSHNIFGAVYNVTMDNSHPLAYGYDGQYFSLKTSASRYAYLQNGWNVGYLKGEVEALSGFAGYKANKELKNSLVFGVQDLGRGQVIYMVDDPLFRAFWHSGKLLFANAIFMVD